LQDFRLTGGNRVALHGLRGSSRAYYLAALRRKVLILCADSNEVDTWQHNLRTFWPDVRIFHMPALDGSPFAFTQVHPATRRARLRTLHALASNTWDVIIAHPMALVEPLAPDTRLVEPTLHLRVGESYDIGELALNLANMGFINTDLATQPGDFSKRGGVMDIYVFAHDLPLRLEFFDDELEEIRVYDPESQRSIKNIQSADVLPLYEWIPTKEDRDAFVKRGGDLWNKNARKAFLPLVAQLNDRGRFPGFLHWTALFFKKNRRFLDLFSDPEIPIFVDGLEKINEEMERLLGHLVLQEGMPEDDESLRAPLSKVFAAEDPFTLTIQPKRTLLVHAELKMGRVDQSFAVQSVPNYQNNLQRFIEHWSSRAKRTKVVIACRQAKTAEKIAEQIEAEDFAVTPTAFPLPNDLPPGFYTAVGQVDRGFDWTEKGLAVIAESDIWSQAGKVTRRPRSSSKKLFQNEFRDLKVGDYVVHEEQGIGRFLGLVEMEAAGRVHEMMALEYRDGQKLYVSLNQLDLVQRHSASGEHMSLDKMGGTTWAKTKSRVKKAVREMAGELLKLYASRRLTPGHAYAADTEWQANFEDAFEHEPTDGQLSAVADIKRDLESPKPMDRLLVGDVGFGKTEVAMRMAFKIVMDGKQVAVLCPTTVLAFQHFHTFKKRFADFPVEIAYISRFTSTKDTKEILQRAAEGAVDILIGTHRILSKDVQIKNLGGLIIDEEQRFGVAHKEKLKDLRKQVEVLSMSATPIPRTLNMSMSGIRDISIIETAPRNRMAINTNVVESRQGLLQSAMEAELDRGGQVYFIHNRIETMEQVAINLKKMLPDARITMAHGQMDAKQLERIMLQFMEHEIDILVASTIIENGVDIPNANTMIVNRADKFGLSQLYQLRGRIGRSDRPAYAYLLVPERARMTPLARKRLAALEEFSDLGSGFRVAAMDLELRGAGNLIGAEQAGHVNAIGYDMYIKLLEEAVAELKGEPIADRIHCNVNLNFGAALPKAYIEETNQRLSFYKRIASATEEKTLDEQAETMEDCHGPLPEPAQLLLAENRLRIFLASRGILSADREKQEVKLRFHETAQVDAEVVMKWIQERSGVSVTPDSILTLPLESREPEAVMTQIKEDVAALFGEVVGA
jgi:transcription-repair coupling factor (superfamily II helicase)